MELHLNSEDARLLHDLLEDYLPTLRMEVARTDVRDLRHELVLRQELVERLIARLTRAAA
jgi:hypothetical protein